MIEHFTKVIMEATAWCLKRGHPTFHRINAHRKPVRPGGTNLMPEHFTKATTQASVWCLKCGHPTMHRIDDGRRGPCLDCLNKPPAPPKPKPTPATGNLFDKEEPN